MAKILISSQLSISIGAMVLYNYFDDESLFLSVASIWALVIGAMAFSNATKNQTDGFSRCMQSYWTKTHNAIFYASIALFYDLDLTGQLLFSGLAIALTIDAMIGYSILYNIFGGQSSNVEIYEEFLNTESQQ